MNLNIAQKIIKNHLVAGDMTIGKPVSIKIDQTLTQDATGTMAYLQFEAMGIDKVQTERSVAYIDHNTLQSGFMNADDHKYIQTVCSKHGIYYSRPGNGICHQIHLERFGIPGKTLLGSDSHTPTCGGLGMFAMGAGGLDVAVAMGGGAYDIIMPSVIKINLIGKLRDFVSAKDIILEVLRILSVKGGVGRVIEYSGSGIKTLTVPERATITNMGAELGATTSIFPSDEITKDFLKAQNRENDFVELFADEGAEYEKVIDIDLSKLTPLAACPHSPDNIKSVSELAGMKIDQVCIGSCTNSSYLDMMRVAKIIKGKNIDPNVSLVIAPGSKQVLNMLAANGALADMISAGARVIECACGPCIGMGQSPKSAGISLRTFNRNFEGRSGTADAKIYLVSPETAIASAIKGSFTSPLDLDPIDNIEMPNKFLINDNMIDSPSETPENVEIVRGPNIKPFPINSALPDKIQKPVLLKVGDNITTDHIMPAGTKILPYRSNIPYLSQFCFEVCDTGFPKRALEQGGGFIIGGYNYGQGSSREHAALVPLYLGVKAVIALSFARIHSDNLLNSGILPLVFENEEDYNKIHLDDELVIKNLKKSIANGIITINNMTGGYQFNVIINLSKKQLGLALSGGLLNYTKNNK